MNCYCPYKRPEIKAFERHYVKSIKLDKDGCQIKSYVNQKIELIKKMQIKLIAIVHIKDFK